MSCYINATDRIGAIKVEIFQTRVHFGPRAGFWELQPIVPALRGFIWPLKFAVMDDFGNLVEV